jgi:Fe-S-cluster-containing dehydrogenase component
MCFNRIDEGGEPACAHNCPAEAILCDTVENVSRILRERYAKDANRMGGYADKLD